jgi:hypothetical protein
MQNNFITVMKNIFHAGSYASHPICLGHITSGSTVTGEHISHIFRPTTDIPPITKKTVAKNVVGMVGMGGVICL